MTSLESAPIGNADAGRYASLTLVRDGDGYILGNRRTSTFVAVPEIGGQVILWLQDGYGLDECARRAEDLVGETVDVAGFLAGLAGAGVLTEVAVAGEPVVAEPVPDIAAWKHLLGRVLYGPVSVAIQVALALAAVVGLVVDPQARPTYHDAIASGLPLASLLVIAACGTALGLAHEFGHVTAAWAAGVPSRITIGRRMITIVYQTDLTRLWSVPRRARAIPLLAGLMFDGATLGVLVIVEATALRGAVGFGAHLVRALVYVDIYRIVFQFLIFMRTDVYALFVLATGCKNLWGTKGALVRRAFGRATGEDLGLLAGAGPREIAWAKLYLCLYVPGVLGTATYFGLYGLPAIGTIMATAYRAVVGPGLASIDGAAGAVALVLTLASTGFILSGLARTGHRLVRQLVAAPRTAR